MKISRVGVDLAKSVFQLHGADAQGKAVWKRRLSRNKWVAVNRHVKMTHLEG